MPLTTSSQEMERALFLPPWSLYIYKYVKTILFRGNQNITEYTGEWNHSTHLAQVRRRSSRLSSKVDTIRSTPASSFTVSRLYLTFSCQCTTNINRITNNIIALIFQHFHVNNVAFSVAKAANSHTDNTGFVPTDIGNSRQNCSNAL